MPQADLSYSSEIALDPKTILARVESVIAAHDGGAGMCKGRAHALANTHHTHVLLRLRLLNKTHRDDAFMQELLSALETALRPLIPGPCILSIELGFLETHNATFELK
jgi:hypothetical protein